ncbi:YybH family protein [Carboxylicivirga marina]|nr:nuclear transport factor 2 family protein [Carboxylicivirga marina]
MSIVLVACSNKLKSSEGIIKVDVVAKNDILTQMEASRRCWDNGDFKGYMQVYWQSDSLTFMGLNNLTKGWQSTLDNYKKGYPTADHRGTLTYQFTHFNQLSEACILVVGNFHLERKMGNVQGNFSLIWKKIEGQWRIILDHT